MSLQLPEPMLARSGEIASGRGWTFEPKLDGFRCLVCTHAVFRARSRRGWDMTHLLPEFRKSVPEGVQLDGELVALAADGRPDFHRLSSRMLHGNAEVALTLFVFDVLAVEGLSTTMQPYAERRAILEELDLENQRVKLVATFEDGEALFDAVCERGLEGVVAKRERDPYRPGERSWVKTKNRPLRRRTRRRRPWRVKATAKPAMWLPRPQPLYGEQVGVGVGWRESRTPCLPNPSDPQQPLRPLHWEWLRAIRPNLGDTQT